MLIDTHCHIHDVDYSLDAEEVLLRAHEAGVMKVVCVGTDELNSELAVEFAKKHEGVYATVGVHPHEIKDVFDYSALDRLVESDSFLIVRPVDSIYSENGFALGINRAPAPINTRAADVFLNKQNRQGSTVDDRKIIAIGEIGLDYFYDHSPRDKQIEALEIQIDLALKYDLPIVFHVRDAYDDFWSVLDNFKNVRGELHCFSDTMANAEEGLKCGLYISVNGMSTFTKNEAQKEMFASIPLNKLLLETDAPYLTPTPFRGKVNEPAFVRNVAEHHAMIRGISVDAVADATTTNACKLFCI